MQKNLKLSLWSCALGLALSCFIPTTTTAQVIRVPFVMGASSTTEQVYDFGDVQVGQYVTTTFQYKNSTGGALGIVGSTAEGVDLIGTDCPSVLSAQGTCSITIGFLVTSEGYNQGAVRVDTDKGSQPDILTVKANGVTSGQILTVNPSTKQYSTLNQEETFTITNDKLYDVSVSNIMMSNNYWSVTSNNCIGKLATGASCKVNAKYINKKAGAYSGTLKVVSQSVTVGSSALSGNTSLGVATFASNDITAQDLKVNQVYTDSIVLKNTGSGSMTVTNVGLDLASPYFSLINNGCTGISLAPQATCSVDFKIVFSAPSVLQRALVFSLSNASSSSASLNVYGSATSVTSLLSVTPGSISFPDQPIGGTSTSQQLILKSVGNTAISVSNINLSGADGALFNIVNKADCLGSLAPDQQCTLNITYGGATKAGNNSTTLSFVSNSTSPAPTVLLKGVSVAPVLVATPSPVVFAGNSGSDYFQNIAVSNTSTVGTTLKTLNVNNTVVALDGSSCAVNSIIPSGGSCALKVNLSKSTPAGTGSSSITITHGGANLVIPVNYNLTPLKNDPIVSEISCPTVSASTLVSALTSKGLDSCTVSITNTSTTAPLYVPVNGISRDKTAPALFNGAADEVSVATTIAPGTTTTFNIGHQVPSVAGSTSGVFNISTTPVLNSTDLTFSIQKTAVFTTVNPVFELTNSGCGASAPVGGFVTCFVRMSNKSLSKYSVIQPYSAKKQLYAGAKFSEAKLNGALFSTLTTEKPTDDFSPTATQFKWALTINTCSSTNSSSVKGVAVSDFCEGIITFNPTKAGSYDVPLYLVPGVGAPVKAAVNASFSVTEAAVGNLSAVTCPPLSVGAKATCTATLTNPATITALTINSIAITPEASGTFGTATSNCGASLAAKGSCIVSIPVTGVTPGNYTTSLKADTSAGVFTTNASVTVSTATASLVLSNFTCPPTTEGNAVTCSGSLKNNGTLPYSISGFNVVNKTSGFGVVTAVSNTVAPGATTTLSLPFVNAVAGTYTTSVVVSATGYKDVTTNANAVVSPSPAAVGTLSPLSCGSIYFSQNGFCVATLKNTSTVKSLTVGAVTTPGSTASVVGAPTSTCGATLAAGASCVYSIPVTGTSSGSFPVSLQVATNPVLIQRATLSVAPLVFSVVQAPTATGLINTVITSRTSFVNKNSFKVMLPSNAVTLAGVAYKISANGCANVELAPEQACNVDTTITTSIPSVTKGTVTLKYGGATAVGNLATSFGTPTLAIAPLSTPTKAEGFRSLSGDWYVLSNPNQVPLTLSSISMLKTVSLAVADKNIPGACFVGRVLQSGESCNIFERFNVTSMLTASQANTNSGTVRAGNGVTIGWASAWTTMKAAAALDKAAGTSYPGGTYTGVVKFTNTASVSIKNVTLVRQGVVTAASPLFNVVDSSCTNIVVPNGTCNITFEVSNLKIGANTVPMEVTGTFQTIINGKPSGDWGEQAVVATPGTLSVTVSTPTATLTAGAYGNSSVAVSKFANTSAYPVYVTGVDVAGAADQYLSSTTCLNSWVAPKATCDVITTRQIQTGDLAITRTPAKITVTIFGTYPFTTTLVISPVLTNAVNFGDVVYGSSAAKTVPLYNGGSTPWTVSAIALPVSVKRISSATTDCPVTPGFTLAAGQKCDLRLSWSPADEGIFDDVMKMTNSWTGMPVINVNLTGNGIIPVGTKIVPAVTSFCPVSMALYDNVNKEIVSISATSLASSTMNGTTVNPGLYFGGYSESGLSLSNCKYVDVTPKGAVEPVLSYANYFSTSARDSATAQFAYSAASNTYVLLETRQGPNNNGSTYITPPIRYTLALKPRGNVKKYLVSYDPFVRMGTYYSSMHLVTSFDNSVSYIRHYEGSTGVLQVYRINTSSASGVDILPVTPFYGPGSAVTNGSVYVNPAKMLGDAAFNMVDSADKNLIWGQFTGYGVFTYNVQTGEIIKRSVAAGGSNNTEYSRFAIAVNSRAMTSDGMMYGLESSNNAYTVYSLNPVTKEYKVIATYPPKSWALTNASISRIMVDSTQKYLIVLGNGYLEKLRIKP